jgi:hypothetical protein
MGGMGAGSSQAAIARAAQEGWQDGMQLHSRIENTRAVFVHDDEMVSTDTVNWADIPAQNGAVNAERVYENLDRMAVALAGLEAEDPQDLTANAAAAWEVVFDKPEGRAWGDLVVGIRPNALDLRISPRWSIIKKLTVELNRLGVPYGNIYVWDGGESSQQNNRCTEYYQDSDLHQDVKVFDSLPDLDTIVQPDGQTVMCPVMIKDGTMDMLINVPVNKGHDKPVGGGFTLAMKNHFGTTRGAHDWDTEDTTLAPDNIAISKTPEVLNICHLNVIDGIWSTRQINYGLPDHATHIMAMSTFAPILDWLVVRKIRDPQQSNDVPWGMGVTNTQMPVLENYVSAFGYDPQSDELQNLDLINALTYEPTVSASPVSASIGPTVTLSVPRVMYKAAFQVPAGGRLMNLSIFAMNGTRIRSLDFRPSGEKVIPITWDGNNEYGNRVPQGTYNVVLTAGRQRMTRQLALIHR